MDSGNYSCRSPQSYRSLTPGNLRDSLADMLSGANGSQGASYDQQRRRISQPPGQNGNSEGRAYASAMNPPLIAGNPSDRCTSLAPEPCSQRLQIGERFASLPSTAHNYVGAGEANASTSSNSQMRNDQLTQLQRQCDRDIGKLENFLTEIQQPPPAPTAPASRKPASLRATSRKPGGETVCYGEVILTRHTGVRAIADNSPLDALFMCLSYNRLSDVITSEIHQQLSDISGSRDIRAMQTLQALLQAFNTIEFDRETGTPLPSGDLHRLRTIYPLDNPVNLNPTTIIKYLLNDIYGHTDCHTHTHLSDQTDLCRPVAFIDIVSDQILIAHSEEESENLNKKILHPLVPDNLESDQDTYSEIRSPSNPAVVSYDNSYFKDNKLIMRATYPKDWHIVHGAIPLEYTNHWVLSWLENELNGLFLSAEGDDVYQPYENRRFLRSLTIKQTDDMVVPIVTEQKMSGYTAQTPNKGLITTRIYRRATNVSEMISKAWMERIKAQRGDRMAQQLLPEQDNCPQVLIAALPEYRAEQQINIDWQLDVHLPTSSGDSTIPYKLSALISRDKSHCLAWLYDRERNLLHCADSRGTTDPEGNAIPIQVTAPYPGGDDALRSAGLDCGSRELEAIFAATSQRITSLGTEVCLLIYRKSPDA